MQMKSKSQRGFLWANNPKVAAKMENDTPKGKKLPMRLHPAVMEGLASFGKLHGKPARRAKT
jgi:hypothetical protein